MKKPEWTGGETALGETMTVTRSAIYVSIMLEQIKIVKEELQQHLLAKQTKIRVNSRCGCIWVSGRYIDNRKTNEHNIPFSAAIF